MKKIALCFVLALMTSVGWAGSWQPTRSIEIVVPFAAGGPTDSLARIVSNILTDHGWENSVVNRPGADSIIGANYVAASQTRGHTLLVGGMGFLDANLASRTPLPGISYTAQSFKEISPIGFSSMVLVSSAGVPVKDYNEFKKWVTQNPKRFNLGFWNQQFADVFVRWAELENLPRPTIIPYKGSAPMKTDLLGGQIEFAFDSYISVNQLIDADKIRLLGVYDTRGANHVRKITNNPNLPALSQNHPDVQIFLYTGVFGAADTPDAAVREYNAVINRGLRDPRYAESFQKLKYNVAGGTPEDLKQLHTRLYAIMEKILKNQK